MGPSPTNIMTTDPDILDTPAPTSLVVQGSPSRGRGQPLVEVAFWTEKRSTAALLLAEGRTQTSVAEMLRVSRRTIANWLLIPQFSAEVDRLSLMVAAASRAARLRIANKAIRQFVDEETGVIDTNKDLLDWLKYAQGETDGVKLDLVNLLSRQGNGGDDDDL